jgi:hypothetical protein
MKALDILKMYAEKGAEPPPSMVEQLTRHALAADENEIPPAQDARGALIQAFMGFLFAACLGWGAGQVLAAYGGPEWAKIAAKGTEGFFGFGAFGFIVAALFTRSK